MDDKADLSIVIAPIKDRMFATVWRILRHPQDAEDALQNALVTIWRRRTQVESHPAPHALILRICADAAIDQFRRRRMDHVDVDMLKDQTFTQLASPGMLRSSIVVTLKLRTVRRSKSSWLRIDQREGSRWDRLRWT